MARSIAILMMLEGHFTGAALDWQYRSYDYFLFQLWHLLHGLTSPLFFTVTGLIFVYLLLGHDDKPFFENIRIKKGRKRILQLLFWGYLIQLNLWSIAKSIYYGSNFQLDWFYAFHVLQSIGVGLGIVILVYGLYKLINFGKLYWYYLITAVIIFAFYSVMKDHIITSKALVESGAIKNPQYWPPNAPAFIQNMFYGKFSDFSFVRMSGYTLLGGMIGSIIRINEHHVKKWWFGATVIVSGLLISIFIRYLFIWVDDFTEWIGLTTHGVYELNSTSISRFGQVTVLIGILIIVDKIFHVKAPLFLKVGQNTFPIYVVHVIILYGGIFGFGLKPYLINRDQEPWMAILIAAIAILLSIVMVKYIEPLTNLYNKVLIGLRLKKRDN